jgi:hypothetical protein
MKGMWVSALIGLVNAITGLIVVYLTPEGDRSVKRRR